MLYNDLRHHFSSSILQKLGDRTFPPKEMPTSTRKGENQHAVLLFAAGHSAEMAAESLSGSVIAESRKFSV